LEVPNTAVFHFINFEGLLSESAVQKLLTNLNFKAYSELHHPQQAHVKNDAQPQAHISPTVSSRDFLLPGVDQHMGQQTT
jgi:hypothetical protein